MAYRFGDLSPEDYMELEHDNQPTYTLPSQWNKNLTQPTINPFIKPSLQNQPADYSTFLWLAVGGLALILVLGGKGRR